MQIQIQMKFIVRKRFTLTTVARISESCNSPREQEIGSHIYCWWKWKMMVVLENILANAKNVKHRVAPWVNNPGGKEKWIHKIPPRQDVKVDSFFPGPIPLESTGYGERRVSPKQGLLYFYTHLLLCECWVLPYPSCWYVVCLRIFFTSEAFGVYALLY